MGGREWKGVGWIAQRDAVVLETSGSGGLKDGNWKRERERERKEGEAVGASHGYGSGAGMAWGCCDVEDEWAVLRSKWKDKSK